MTWLDLRTAAAVLSGRASARRFWRVVKAGFPVILPMPPEPAHLRTNYSADFLYILTTDEVRMTAFRQAISRRSFRSVLEVGCGPWAPLMHMAISSGVEQLVAIEASPVHAAAARRQMAAEIRRGRVVVLDGRVGHVEGTVSFPEGFKPDLIVAELLGYTASEEGAPAVFADLQRRFGPVPTIPRAACSLMAPVKPLVLSLRDRCRNWLVHGTWLSPGRFVPGRWYDCRNIPRSWELAEPQIWEEFDFESPDQDACLQQQRELSFRVPAGAEVGGLLLWMRAEVDKESTIDTRRDNTSWNQYYIHLPPQRVGPDGRLVVRASVDARGGDVAYEFRTGGAAYRSHG